MIASMFKELIESVRRMVEDPNNFFMPVPPKEGRSKPATSELMGTEKEETADAPRKKKRRA